MIEQLDFLTLYKIRDFYLLWSSPDSLLFLWNQKPGDSFLLFEFAQTHIIKEVSVVYVCCLVSWSSFLNQILATKGVSCVNLYPVPSSLSLI